MRSVFLPLLSSINASGVFLVLIACLQFLNHNSRSRGEFRENAAGLLVVSMNLTNVDLRFRRVVGVMRRHTHTPPSPPSALLRARERTERAKDRIPHSDVTNDIGQLYCVVRCD